MNLKRTGFLTAGAQCDILFNCAIQIALLNRTKLNDINVELHIAQ